MKNHSWQDGKLLQTNKKWSQLKNSQRSWIQEITREEHADFVEQNGRLPIKKRKAEVIDKVHERVNARSIWIPYGELYTHVAKAIDKLNHKSPLFVPPKQKPASGKPKPPKAGVEEFPPEVQGNVKTQLEKSIERYIAQAHRIPPNKVRDGEIKQVLRGFNSKKWREYGMQMQKSVALLTMYNELRDSVFAAYSASHAMPVSISKHRRDELRDSTVILETDRLTLRKMNGRDYKEVRVMLADPEVMYAWEQVFTTKREVMDWIIRQMRRYNKDLVGYFAAIDRETGEMVGQIGLMWNDIQGKRCLEVGYILKKSCWGNGYAAEGAKACIEYGLSLFGIDAVYATIRPENAPSIAVAERIGMTPVGEYNKKYNGKSMNHQIYRTTK